MMLVAVAALTLAAAPPPKPFTAGPSIEGVSEYSLPNGLKVLFVPDSSKPTTTVNLTVFVGSRHENYGEKGMAHLFEHMLFKKTKKFGDVKQELTKLGGMANGTTWFDRTNYFEIFPYDDAKVKTAIELEAERLRNAIISREQLLTEMTVVRNEFEMGENQPDGVLEERVMAAAFQWHNYGNTTIGAKSDIEKVPNERLLAFYETYYQPDNAMLIVAGKFDEAKTFKFIADTFGKLPKPRRTLPTTYTDEPTHDGETTVTVRRVGGTPVVMVGYHVPAASDPDAPAVDLLDSLLGDSPSGRLYKELVETKKAARVACSSYTLREPGYFMCRAQLNAKDPSGPARDGLLSVLEGFAKKPPTKEEVERAKTAQLKEFELLLNSSERVGIYLSEYAAMGDWRLLFLSRDRIEKLTVEDVVRVAGKYFKVSNRTLGEYVPTEKPERAEISAAADLGPVLKDYKGKAEMAQGEAFDATPKNIDARTQRPVLSGGTRLALLTKKTRGETVQVNINLKFGSEKSLQGQRVAGDFAARMLMRGTKSKTRQQVKDAFDALKAQVHVQPQPQGVVVSVEVRKPQLAAALDLVGEVLKTPAFDAKEFEQLRREVLAQYEQQKDDPMAIGQIGLQRVLSPFQTKGHPLYVPSIQELIADATALKVEDSKAYHAKFYGAQSGYIAVVGDFDEKATQAQLEKLFGAWKSPEAYTRIPVPFVNVEQKNGSIETPDKKMAFYGAGTIFKLKDSDPDYAAMLIADYMLGGGFLNGRVPQRLREKEGLSYGAGTHMRAGTHEDFAAIIGYAIYAPENVGKIETGFNEEIARAVEKGFTEAELKLAREGLLKELESARADDGELAGDLVQQLDLGRTTAFDQQIEDKLKSLSLKEVNETLKKYVDPKKFSSLKVGDFKQVAAPK
ncbi:MAG: insulinase family protein [Archangium gephyra]|uniref:Insulinase family protein n=1 Tax=Archangium gephyra TaxID=48 RepID=A0A2W5TV16_9BACT|nr:MAG: insulinase family protein [Archangium gephyra]